MPLVISAIEGIENALLATVTGNWHSEDFHAMLTTIEQAKPDYVVVDPTHSIIPSGQTKAIENANERRTSVVTRVVKLLQDNPQMLYIMVNRNDTPVLKTSVTLYEEAGVANRWLFTLSYEEALEIIAEQEAKK